MGQTPDTNDTTSTKNTTVPFALETAAAWSWRLLVVAGAGWVLWQGLAKVSLLVISLMVAALLAALLSPAVYALRKRGVRAGAATAIAEIGMIVGLLALVALTGQQLAQGFVSLWSKALEGYNELVHWLDNMGYSLGAEQLNQLLEQGRKLASENPSSIVRGVSEVGSTAAEVATGTLITLFTLVFFLMEGERIWLFIVGLFPRRARNAVNGAGRAGWKSLGAYVRVQILVAAIDAVGIGIGAAILGVPLAIPLGVLVFLGSFIPVIGALLSGAVAVLLALVALGPVQALIMIGIVLLVQQLESHILQPLIMGKAVSLHPLAVIFAVAGGSMIFGATGALFAVPVLAVVNSVVRYLASRGWENDSQLRTEEFLFPHEERRREAAKRRRGAVEDAAERVRGRARTAAGRDEEPAEESASAEPASAENTDSPQGKKPSRKQDNK